MRTLREQITEIGNRRVNVHWVRSAGFVQAVYGLAARAFGEQWPESADTRAVRRAYLLLSGGEGLVSPEEPEVE